MMKQKLLIFVLLLFLIVNVSAESITVDSVSESSISWNLSSIISSKIISYVAFDGILLKNYGNTSLLVQNNLYPNEVHTLTVNTTDNMRYNLSAYTLDSAQNKLMKFINQYIFIILVVGILVLAYFTIPWLAFIGFIIAFIGLTTTINFSFELGSIFVILMCASFFIAVKGED